MRIIEMRQERAKLVKEAREILDLQEVEKRDLSAEEEQRYDRLMEEVDKLGTSIEREERQAALEAGLEDNPPSQREKGPWPTDDKGKMEDRASEAYMSAFQRFVTSGTNALTADEYRAMQADNDVGGGYIVAPQQFVAQLLKAVDDIAPLRQYATVFPLATSASLGVPTLEDDVDDADWTPEIATGGESEIGFGKRELRPYALAKLVKVSNKLLRLAAINPDQLVRERLAYKHGVAAEKAYMTGDGNQKPLGLFTASADGISTSRDVAGANTKTTIKADTLIDAKYALKGQYHARARWMLHRLVLAEIRKLKDDNGQYLWQPGIAGGVPDRILEIPYTLSEYAPSTLAQGKYVAILGDFRYYWIADALDMQIQRLVELYARSNQTGFIGRLETDGMPVLEEAFVRLQMATS
jgi:HK97 family phage major capsid protein